MQKAIEILESDVPMETRKADIREKYQSIFEEGISLGKVVLLGASPYAKKVAAVLESEYGLICRVIDIGPTRGVCMPAQEYLDVAEKEIENVGKSALYIICSSPYLGFFAGVLRKKGYQKAIPYHALPAIHEKFDFPKRTYSAAFFYEGMASILNNIDLYKELLESLADEESRELFSKIICYRMTADLQYATVPAYNHVYFGHSFLPVSSQEHFIDGGGYDGDTLAEYIASYNTFSGYMFFEPDNALLDKARARYPERTNIQYYNYALSDKEEDLRFQVDAGGIGAFSEDGDTVVHAVKLDDIAKDYPVSFLKLDIEGAELACLRGAANLIRRNKPKLALSAYHNASDYVDLFCQVRELVPDYKYYLRCAYGSLYADVVLFAVREKRR